MSKLIIAEKPSVAKSIASAWVLHPADGFYEGSGLLVSWCVGHLVSPMDAGGYDERFKKWRYDDLPFCRSRSAMCWHRARRMLLKISVPDEPPRCGYHRQCL